MLFYSTWCKCRSITSQLRARHVLLALAVVVFFRQLSNAADKPQETDDELYARALQDPAIRERAASMPREEVIQMLRQMQRMDKRALRNISTVRARYVR